MREFRKDLTIEGLLDIEDTFQRVGGQTSPIVALHRQWRNARSRFGLPPVAPFERAHRIDVGAERPENYVLRNHTGKSFGNFTDTRIADYPAPSHAAHCMAEYLACKYLEQPLCHYIDNEYLGVKREYVRMLLPLQERGKVTQLVYAYRCIVPPTRVHQRALA